MPIIKENFDVPFLTVSGLSGPVYWFQIEATNECGTVRSKPVRAVMISTPGQMDPVMTKRKGCKVLISWN